jgi:hypothetical protein
MGGMQALDRMYGSNKAIELNETDYYPVWYGKVNDKVAASRVEAWEFIVGGERVLTNRNALFRIRWKTEDNALVCKALESLMKLLQF